MLTEEEWARIKAKWIAEGRIPDDKGYYHFIGKDSSTVYIEEKNRKDERKVIWLVKIRNES